MSQNIEAELRQIGKQHMETEVPQNLHEYVQKGLDKRPSAKNARLPLRVCATILTVLAMFTATIRLSPAFAQAVSTIPGLEYIVDLIYPDSSLMLAHEMGYTQPVGEKNTMDGISISVDGIMADESGYVIFYTVENNSPYKYISIEYVQIKNEGLDYSLSHEQILSDSKISNGKINCILRDKTEMPESLDIIFSLSAGDSLNTFGDGLNNLLPPDSTMEITANIDKGIFLGDKKEYKLAEEFTIDQQRIFFDTLTVYPTRAELKIYFDESNTMEVFDFENLHLKDEKGNSYKLTEDHLSKSRLPNENSVLYTFQSNYLFDCRELYICADGIRALDKDDLYVKVKPKTGEILNSNINGLSFDYFGTDPDNYNGAKKSRNVLSFWISTDKVRHYTVFDSFVYDENRDILFEAQGTGTIVAADKSKLQAYIYFSEDESIDEIIYLKLIDYPNVIASDMTIKAK